MDLFLEALKWILTGRAGGFIVQLGKSFSTPINRLFQKKETLRCRRAARAGCGNQGEPSPAGAPGQAKTEKKAFKAQAKQQKASRRKFLERAERPVIHYFNYYPEAQQRRL